MSTVAPAPEYRFGRFRLRPAERQLLEDGEPAKLGGRAFDLLQVLIERRERTVTRRELFDLVWAGRVVEDHNLQVQVLALRKVLGPSAIATVPGRGYRFTAALDQAAVPSAAEPAHAPQMTPPDAGPPTNLPSDLPLLHGRDADIAAVAKLVAGNRLVTIAGIGGIGKTRLAQAVGRALRAQFADGVWFVELAAVSDGALVASTVAHTIGLTANAARTSAEGLARSLSSLALLLVLDNCEHVVASASDVAAALMRVAPKVHVLAASQEPLKVTLENLYRIGTLALPDDTSLDHARAAAAVSLFVARATAAEPRFALTPENLDAVIDICRQLDGIPLALELAAARVPLLGVDGVRARLGDRFRLLTGGARSAPARHRTLRATLDWSHSLLSPDEQAVFRRLGVCAGTFGLALAQQVGAQQMLDAWDVLDHLGALVDKSLVLAERGDEPRYRLLESSRAFALEQLAAAGERAGTQRRHADAVLAQFVHAETTYPDLPVFDWLETLTPDLDNWRDAFHWAVSDNGDRTLAVALATFGAPFLAFAGFSTEGVRARDTVHAWVDDVAEPAVRARFALTEAQLGGALAIGPAQTLEAARRAVAMYRDLDDRFHLYWSLGFVEQFAERVGAVDAIRPAIDEMVRLERPDWSVLRCRIRRQAQARQMRREGRWADNRDAFLAEAALFERAGDLRSAWYAIHAAAMAEIALGNAPAAVALMHDVVVQIRARGLTRQLWPQVAMHATALIEVGDTVAAMPAAREAIALLRVEGALAWMVDQLPLLPMMRGDLAAAAQVLGWADAKLASGGYGARSPFYERSYRQLLARLDQAFAPAELEPLRAQGAALGDDEVAERVLGNNG